MSTQVMDKVTSKSSLSADQQARAAAFAQKELQHASDALPTIPSYSGSGTVTYNVSFVENSDGFAQISWGVSASLGMFCIQQNDWVGMFPNYDQALHNPKSNYLGGLHGWTWASDGSSFTTDVAPQAGMVAAYIIKNATGDYVTVAISAPFPS